MCICEAVVAYYSLLQPTTGLLQVAYYSLTDEHHARLVPMDLYVRIFPARLQNFRFTLRVLPCALIDGLAAHGKRVTHAFHACISAASPVQSFPPLKSRPCSACAAWSICS